MGFQDEPQSANPKSKVVNYKMCLSVNGNDSDLIILEQIEGPGARRIGAFLLDAIVNERL